MILKPTPVDPRDKRFHFHKLFGTTVDLPTELDLDAHLTMPDQMADRRPTECTAFTVTDIATDQDKVLYSHDFQMMKTLVAMGIKDATNGADLRTAFSVPSTAGLLPKTQEPSFMASATQEWAINPANWPIVTGIVYKPNYIPISPEGTDWFDAIRNALSKGFTVGMGTQWSPDFETSSVILTENPTKLYFGHAWKVLGVHLINGVLYLRVKSWQGQKYDHGICYMSRTLVNKLMSQWGTYAATLAHLDSDVVDTLKQQKITLMEQLLALYQNLLHVLIEASKTAPVAPVQVPVVVSTTTTTKVPVTIPPMNPDELLPWDTSHSLTHENFHNVRVLCDLEGLSPELKEELCATVWGESDFNTHAKCENYKLRSDGTRVLASTDHGISQWNDYWHKSEITPDEAVNDPEKAVRLMCKYFLKGEADQWVAHKTGRFKQFLGKKL